jgi:glycosyltransferase involved in cell wall biosynthesis
MDTPTLCKQKLTNYKVAVIIPTYNNIKTVASVIDAVLEYASDVIVVNDGSTDKTLEVLDNYRTKVHVESYPVNRGKGYALTRGFKVAMQKGFSYAITIDSDGQHFASDLPLFAGELDQHPHALMVGSRGMKHDNMAGGSTFANKFSNFWFRLQTATNLPDTQSGFRLYPLHKMGKMKVFTNRYEAELELLVFSAWRGIKMVAVPISVYYAPPEEKVSHFRPFHDFFRISVLNTVLVFMAVCYGYPSMGLRKLFRV